MTTLEEAAALASRDHGLVVISTLRDNGTIQASLVNAGVIAHPVSGENVLGLVTAGRIKLANLRARPQVTAIFRDGWQWAAVEGHTELVGPMIPSRGWMRKVYGSSAEESSPLPAGSMTTGTNMTGPWPKNGGPPC